MKSKIIKMKKYTFETIKNMKKITIYLRRIFHLNKWCKCGDEITIKGKICENCLFIDTIIEFKRK